MSVTNPPPKKFIIFLEMELSSPNIEKIIFASKESFSYISRNGTLRFSSQAQKIKEIHQRKISFTSGNKNPQNFFYIFLKEILSYILGNKSFLYFRRQLAKPENQKCLYFSL